MEVMNAILTKAQLTELTGKARTEEQRKALAAIGIVIPKPFGLVVPYASLVEVQTRLAQASNGPSWTK